MPLRRDQLKLPLLEENNNITNRDREKEQTGLSQCMCSFSIISLEDLFELSMSFWFKNMTYDVCFGPYKVKT